jgi:type I restriction enzyme, S subunit
VSELPAGWAKTTLSEIVALGPKSIWPDDTEIGFVPMSHAPTNFRDVLRHDVRWWHEVKKSYTHFENGDIIFAKVTPCFENGKAALVSGLPNGAGAGSSEFHVLRPRSPEISASYLLALIKSSDFLRDGEKSMTGAVGLRRVPRAFVEQFPVPLPPAAEQKRIAHKLDSLLAQVDTLKARIGAIPALLKRFRRATLSAVVCGNLTRSIEGASESEWTQTTIGEVCASSFYGPRFSKDDYTDSSAGLPTIRTTDMTDDGKIVVTDETPRVLVPKEKTETFRAKIGDLLVTRTGSIGVMAIFEGDYEAIPSAYLIRFRFTPAIVPRYAFICLMSPSGQAAMGMSTTAITQPNINAESIKAIRISLPPIGEQNEIVLRVEQLFTFADKLEAKVAAAQKRIDTLTQSILAKAFRGELVPQDPNDEPASVLLERIRALRAEAPTPRRGRKAAAN